MIQVKFVMVGLWDGHDADEVEQQLNETRKEIINEPANRNHDQTTANYSMESKRKKSEKYVDNAGGALEGIPRCNRKCSAMETDPWLSNLLLYSSEYRYPLDYFSLQIEEEERRTEKALWMWSD